MGGPPAVYDSARVLIAGANSMGDLTFDPDLIRRYDRAGPRYTSYPTAVQFGTDFGPQEYRNAAAQSNGRGASRPLSLYVHIPFCASPCFYCGCNRVITRSESRAIAYLARLKREVELQAELFPRTRPVDQLHFGGGTPTFFQMAELGNLVAHLRRHFSLGEQPGREYSIEIDPRTVTPDGIRELAALGFNRMSLGVQDFDENVQRAVNRLQPAAETLLTIDAARAAGVASISLDLIYGLPRQTTASFERTLEQVLDARPDRLAVYAYAHMPQLFKAQRQLKPEELPDAATRLSLLGLTVRKLTDAGYVYIGMDHFALPTDELVTAKRRRTLQRNFQGYSTHADCDLVGLGVSAIGRIGDTYAQNHKLLSDYDAAIDSGDLAIHRGRRLNADDLIRRDVIQQLMCHESVDTLAVGERHGVDFKRYFRHELEDLQRLQADGLIYVLGGTFGVTEAGRLLVRTVAMVFDAYLATGSAYSKVI